jgi:hypothetical protein
MGMMGEGESERERDNAWANVKEVGRMPKRLSFSSPTRNTYSACQEILIKADKLLKRV